MYAEVRIYLCMCTCARTHQDFEYHLQAADAECTDGMGWARQDQRGTETHKGKVSCVMCYDTLVLPLFKSHVTLVIDGPILLCHPDECVMSRL